MQKNKAPSTFAEFSNQFEVKIPFCEQKFDGKVYYQTQITKKGGQTWGIEKTYPDFEALHQALTALTVGVPPLPARTLLFKLSEQEVEQRRRELQHYVVELFKRQDIVGSKCFDEFFCMPEDPPDLIEVSELSHVRAIAMPVVDVHYVDDKQVLFVLMAKQDIETKVKGFFYALTGLEQKKKEVQGRIITFRSLFRNFEFAKAWDHPFYSPPTCMHWDERLTVLAVGLTNGDICLLRVKTEKSYTGYEEFGIIKRHIESVSALIFDARTALLYSASKDRYLVATDVASESRQSDKASKSSAGQGKNAVSESVAGDEKKFPHALTAMALDFINERLYVGSADGSINILSCDNRNLQIVHSIVPLSRNQISCLFLTQKNQFLIAGTERGFVKIFEVRKPGKEKLTSIISTIELPQAVRSVAFSLTQKELYVTHSGSIVIINSQSGAPVRAIAAHSQPINKIHFLEDCRILVTASQDLSVKVHRIRPNKSDEIYNIPKLDKEKQYKKEEQEEEDEEEEEEEDEQDQKEEEEKVSDDQEDEDEDDFNFKKQTKDKQHEIIVSYQEDYAPAVIVADESLQDRQAAGEAEQDYDKNEYQNEYSNQESGNNNDIIVSYQEDYRPSIGGEEPGQQHYYQEGGGEAQTGVGEQQAEEDFDEPVRVKPPEKKSRSFNPLAGSRDKTKFKASTSQRNQHQKQQQQREDDEPENDLESWHA